MAHVFFHCAGSDELVLDRRGSEVEDLSEAHACGMRVMNALMSNRDAHDWRDWTLHASDEEGDEIFLMSFASLLGKPH
jgi:hypothetical protein